MSSLSATEVQDLKEDVIEIKSEVKEINRALGKLQVLIVGNYVTKTEFDKHKDEEINSRRWFAGFIIGASSILMAIINYFKL